MGEGVYCGAYTVPKGGRSKKGDEYVGPGGNAPHAEGLAEVLVWAIQPRVRSDVDQSGQADRRIHQESPGIVDGLAELALQHAVDDDDRHAEVAHKIAYRCAYRSGRDALVDARDGTQHESISNAMHTEVEAVDRLQWIDISRACCGLTAIDRRAGLRVARRTGACGHAH